METIKLSKDNIFYVEIGGTQYGLTVKEFMKYINERVSVKTETREIQNIINDKNIVWYNIEQEFITSEIVGISGVMKFSDVEITITFDSRVSRDNSYVLDFDNKKARFPLVFVNFELSTKNGLNVYGGVPDPKILDSYDFKEDKFIYLPEDIFLFKENHSGLPMNTYSTGRICLPSHDVGQITYDVFKQNKIDLDLLSKYIYTFLFESPYNFDLNSNREYFELIIEYNNKFLEGGSDEYMIQLKKDYIDRIFRSRNF